MQRSLAVYPRTQDPLLNEPPSCTCTIRDVFRHVQSPQAQNATEAGNLRAFSVNSLRAMSPAFKEHPQFCERVLQHIEHLRNEPDLLDALAAALKEHGIPPPAAAAANRSASANASPVTPAVAAATPSVGTPVGSVLADPAVKALPAASALLGAAPDNGPPPGLQRRRTEPNPNRGAATSTPAATNSGEHEGTTQHAELFLLSKERKAAAHGLWENVCFLLRLLPPMLCHSPLCMRHRPVCTLA